MLNRLGLRGAELLIYARIHSYTAAGKPCTIKAAELMEDTGECRTVVYGTIKNLRALGLIEEDRNGGLWTVKAVRNTDETVRNTDAPTLLEIEEREIDKKKKNKGENYIKEPGTYNGQNSAAVPAADRLPPPAEMFAAFWLEYPKKVGKPAARKAFKDKVKTPEDFERIMNGLRRLNYEDFRYRDANYIPNPATWLNRDGWEDEAIPPKRGTGWFI